MAVDYVAAFAHWGGAAWPLLLGWLFMLFYLLGHTADQYFAPTLSTLADRLRVPDNVAGVTLLAFANGAPDVFASIAAFTDASAGQVGVSALLGAGVFVTTFVVGVVVLAAEVRVFPRAFVRDILFYATALVLLVIFSVRGSVTLGISIAFVAVYVGYVAFVVVVEIMWSRRQHVADSSSGVVSAFWHVPAKQTRARSISDGEFGYTFITRTLPEDDDSFSIDMDSDDEGLPPSSLPSSSSSAMAPPADALFGSDGGDKTTFTAAVREDYFPEPSLAHRREEEAKQARMRQRLRSRSSVADFNRRWREQLRHRVRPSDWKSKSLAAKMFYLVELPTIIARRLTIPLLEKELWSRPLLAATPLFAPQFVLWVLGALSNRPVLLGMPLWALALPPSVAMAALLYCTTHRSRPPRNYWVQLVLLSLGFLLCVFWIYTLASELVALLTAMGQVSGMSPSLLALTVLAWGNSLGDLMANVSVARSGFSEMAIAGCYGGPLFNLLIGLGLSLLYQTATNYPHSSPLPADRFSNVALIFLGISLISSLVVVSCRGFSFPRRYGMALIGLYLIFSAVNILMAAGAF
eukprot:PLAT526.1.p1 GENE.PLAT526.1~~PLAT526.1.p1  ORF type:complete len:586 (+),score=215.16 PLAT526.1:27-1760(+)